MYRISSSYYVVQSASQLYLRQVHGVDMFVSSTFVAMLMMSNACVAGTPEIPREHMHGFDGNAADACDF